MRLNCSNLNNDLFNLHVVDSPICSCTFPIEDAKHYFLGCPLYTAERIKLVNCINQLTECTLHTILFGNDNLSFESNCEIFTLVHEFIECSGRFN